MTLDSLVALVTLNEAKEYLKESGSADDAILNALINMASAWVRDYLGRNLVSATFTEYYNGDGSKKLILRNRPISSVTSVHIDNNRAFGALYLVSSDYYIIRKEAGILESFDLLGDWTTGQANIKVVYVAGYTAGTNMPYAIRLAVNRIIDHHFRSGYVHRRLDIQSETIGDRTTTFRDGDIQADVKRMLEPYRKFMPAPQYSYAD